MDYLHLDDPTYNTMLDAIETLWGTAPTFRLRTGPRPATIAGASTGTILYEFSLPSDFLANAASGQKAKAGTWSGTALATGDIGHFEILSATGPTLRARGSVTRAVTLQTTATTSAGSAVLTFASTSAVTVGDAVEGTNIPTGTTVFSKTSTTVTLSTVVTGSGVSSGADVSFGDTSGVMRIPSLTVTSVGQSLTIDLFTLLPWLGS